MAELIVQDLVKAFGAITAVNNISFTIAEGEFLTLLGPSGCGKSTTLAAVAGLEAPTSGLIRSGDTVFYDGARGIYLPPEKRNCGLVFQSYALWPHMTVSQNLAFPLKLRGIARPEQARLINESLKLVEMQAYKDRYPHQLSGGQQQRVALARTLVYSPSVLLLDEPLSNLDAKLRERARTWLDELHRKVRRTTLYVTHDQQEALVLSDRIAVMKDGNIAQLGTPREIYENPADAFVADFIGTTSFLKGTLGEAPGPKGAATVVLGEGIAIRATVAKPFAGRLRAGDKVVAALRPEKLRIVAPDNDGSGDGSVVPATVLSRSYLGARWQYLLRVAAASVKIETEDEVDQESVRLWIPASGCLVFEA